MTNANRRFFIILLLITTLTIIFLINLRNNTTVNDWREYSSQDLGYSFQYPDEWEFNLEESGFQYALTHNGNFGKESRGESFIFSPAKDVKDFLKSADVYQKNPSSLEEYLQMYSSSDICEPTGNAYCLSYKSYEFNSIPGFLITVGGMDNGQEIVFQKDQKIYNIQLPNNRNLGDNLELLTTSERLILDSYQPVI